MRGLARRAALIAALCLALAWPAAAFDPLNLFGGGEPQPRPDALPYAVTVVGVEGEADLAQAVRGASLLEQLKDEAPLDGAELARRAEADLPRLVDALWAQGRYAAAVTIRVGEATSAIGRENGAEAIDGYLQSKSVWINNGPGGGNPFVMKTAG